jgi:hypothetical protein
VRGLLVLTCLGKHWELFGDFPVGHPCPPLRQRWYGFVRMNPNLKISYSEPLGHFILHLTWDFLLPEEHFKLISCLFFWPMPACNGPQ